jgi:hypothetical protein
VTRPCACAGGLYCDDHPGAIDRGLLAAIQAARRVLDAPGRFDVAGDRLKQYLSGLAVGHRTL